MKKRVLKKSEVLREGYLKGLREGLNIINQMINEANNAEMLDEYVTNATKGIMDSFKEKEQEFNSKLQKKYEDENVKNAHHAEYVFRVNTDARPYDFYTTMWDLTSNGWDRHS